MGDRVVDTPGVVATGDRKRLAFIQTRNATGSLSEDFLPADGTRSNSSDHDVGTLGEPSRLGTLGGPLPGEGDLICRTPSV